MEVRRDDRVLVLSAARPAEVAQVADQAPDGLVVWATDPSLVYEARRELRDRENVMIVPADPDGALPWADDFFTVIIATSQTEASQEMLRVLAPAGRLLLSCGSIRAS